MNIKREIAWLAIIFILLFSASTIPSLVYSSTETNGSLEWKEKALEWKGKYLAMRDSRNIWKARSDKWRAKYNECKESDPLPDLAIKSLTIKNGKFVVNGKQTKLIGVSKREMFVVGAGTFPKPINYTYAELKSAILKSKINYIRGIAPLNLTYFRKEVKEYLKHGIVVEVELYNAGKSSCPYQAYWKDTFNAVKDLPVIFDACNEFMDYDRVAKVNTIVNWVVNRGGLVGAGAWGASNYGEGYAKEFMAMNKRYKWKPHHQRWNKASIEDDRELGKPLVWNEIHTRDGSLANAKTRLKLGYEICEGVQVYSLLNFGMGPGSKFQKILDYAGELVK